MRKIAVSTTLATLLLLPASSFAEDTKGFGLMEEGLRLMLRGLMEEAEPALRELEGLGESVEPALRGFVENFGPGLGALMEHVGDFSMYHAPEVLPNGDIILRRKSPKRSEPIPDPGGLEL